MGSSAKSSERKMRVGVCLLAIFPPHAIVNFALLPTNRTPGTGYSPGLKSGEHSAAVPPMLVITDQSFPSIEASTKNHHLKLIPIGKSLSQRLPLYSDQMVPY